MKKILFVCLGNICRSPSAEMIMKKLINDVGLMHQFYIESAGTSRSQVGNPIYPHSKQKLVEKNIPVDENKKSRIITGEDYDKFDYIIAMEIDNIRYIQNIIGNRDKKINCLMDYTDNPRDIADPWYTRDFELAYNEIYEGCNKLLEYLRSI